MLNNPFELIVDRLERIELKLPEQGANTGAIPSLEKPLTRKQLCEYLGVSEPTVIRWERRGKIPSFRIGGAVRYNKTEVMKSLEGKQKTR